MKDKNLSFDLNLKNIGDQLTGQLQLAKRYALPAFIVFAAIIYGFIFLRINTLANAEPSDSDVASQVQAARVPHIDETVVQQLKSLQDNSVSVQSLFNDARSNPFQ